MRNLSEALVRLDGPFDNKGQGFGVASSIARLRVGVAALPY